MIRQKTFVIECEAIPLDIRRKLDLVGAGVALGQGGTDGTVTEIELTVSWDDRDPEPQWQGAGLVREFVR